MNGISESSRAYWTKRGADDYHNDEDPLFTKNRKGQIAAEIDNQMCRELEDNIQEVGEAYLSGWGSQAARFQQRRG